MQFFRKNLFSAVERKNSTGSSELNSTNPEKLFARLFFEIFTVGIQSFQMTGGTNLPMKKSFSFRNILRRKIKLTGKVVCDDGRKKFFNQRF